MKLLLSIAALLGLANANTCTPDAQVRCLDDINKSYVICDKAAKERGKDFNADLQCMKYLNTM